MRTLRTGENGGLSVRFWGVRGDIACGGSATAGYGGNTPCLEVRCDGRPLILDAGTGIRSLGDQLVEEAPIDTDILLTGTCFYRVCGLPFFKPLFNAGNKVCVHAGHLLSEHTAEEIVCELMRAPLFPVCLDMLAADLSFHDFTPGDTLDLKCGARVLTNTPDFRAEAVAYRIEYCGKSICYVIDRMGLDDKPNSNLLPLAAGADYLIYGTKFPNEGYRHCQGRSSAWKAGLDLADAAAAKCCVVYYHDPRHDDAFMDGVAAAAERRRPGTTVAREGLMLTA